MATTKIKVVTPTDLGPQFALSGGKWKVATVSTDTGNLVSPGSDGGALLSTTAVQNAQAYPSFTVSGQTLIVNDGAGHITNVPLGQTDIHVTGASLVGTTLHLSENNGQPDVTLDLSSFIQSVTAANSYAISLTGRGHDSSSPLTATIIIDSISGNLLKVSATGLKVDPADILALLNANTTVSMTVDSTNGVFRTTVNGQSATTPITELVDSSNTHIGYLFQ